MDYDASEHSAFAKSSARAAVPIQSDAPPLRSGERGRTWRGSCNNCGSQGCQRSPQQHGYMSLLAKSSSTWAGQRSGDDSSDPIILGAYFEIGLV